MKYYADMAFMMQTPKEDKSFTHKENYAMQSNMPHIHEEHKVEGSTNEPLKTGLVSRQPL